MCHGVVLPVAVAEFDMIAQSAVELLSSLCKNLRLTVLSGCRLLPSVLNVAPYKLRALLEDY